MKLGIWGRRVIYAVAVFVFVEASLQAFYRVTTGSYLIDRDRPPLFAPDPTSGWTNKPNLSYRHVTPEFAADVYTNSQGFRVSSRHEEYDKEHAAERFRILLLGPSFAYGWGVDYEDTFAVQLEKSLANAGATRKMTIEVLNHGVPSQPPANNLQWFIRHGKDYKPNLVIQLVYGSLEVEATPSTSVVVENGHMLPNALGTVDRIWAYAKTSATVFYSGVIVAFVQKSLYEQDREENIEGAGRDLRNNRSFDPEDVQVKESIALYERFRDSVEQTGAQLLIVHFPLSYVVHPEDRARWALQGVEHIDQQIDFNRAMCAYLNGDGVPCLNLTDDLATTARNEGSRLYYWLDIHWTKEGNARAAELVAQHLTKDHSISLM